VIFGGLQKVSLLEYPGNICAVLFTQGCNFRCPFCHNPNLVDPARFGPTIPEDSILRFLENRRGKLDAVTISGGEPTLQSDLLSFTRLVKSMGYKIKLDTNGSLPEVVESLSQEQLIDYWAMDIKAPLNLYSTVCGMHVKEADIQRSMQLIRSSQKNWEFRTTYYNEVMNWNDILEIQTLLQPGDKYYIQQCVYDNTLVPHPDINHSRLDMLLHKNLSPAPTPAQTQIQTLKDNSRLQQIIVKMR